MARTLWVLALAALAVLVIYGMRRGWNRRKRGHDALAGSLPGVPPGLDSLPELLPASVGLYVGTTIAGDWQNRVTAATLGNRASATARLYRTGVLLDRAGEEPLWIPVSALHDARVDHKLANKVVPGVGMLVITWHPDGHSSSAEPLDSGFRHGDETDPAEWVKALRTLRPTATTDSDSEHDDEAAVERQEET
ncbi:transporter [Actinopolyspora sp. H202]|uniref:PH-like domain-containing protein n=1 Tax=Actinopolyspora sp. H202 TaxID=1500456 RepID=UPI003EE6DBE0